MKPTIITVHSSNSPNIDLVLEHLVNSGFQVLQASPEQLTSPELGCFSADTVVVDYPRAALEDVVVASAHCFGDIPIIWLHEEVPEDQTMAIGGQDIVCIKAPIAAEAFTKILNVLTRAAQRERELVRTSVSLEQLRCTMMREGVRHGDKKATL